MFLGIFLIAVGVFCLWGALTQPAFFWESRKAQRMRRFIGDGGAKILYIVLAIVIIVAGIVLGIMKMYEGKADSLYDQGKYEQGLDYYKQLHSIFKDDITYLNGIAFGNYMLENYEEAREYAELSVSKNKEGNQDANILLAWSYAKQQNLSKAIEALESYLTSDEDDAFAYNEIGKLYRSNEQDDKAADSFKTAIELEPNNGNYYINLAEVYYANAQYENEIEVYSKFINGSIEIAGMTHEDTYNHVYYSLGVAYYSVEKYELAVENFEKAIELTEDADSYYFLASAHSLLGQKEEVLKSLEKAFELNSKYASIIKTDADFAAMLQDEDIIKLIAEYAN